MEDSRPDCERVARELWAFLDREVAPATVAEIEAHLERCAGCRGHFEFEERLRRELTLLRRVHPSPEELRVRVLAVLRNASADAKPGVPKPAP